MAVAPAHMLSAIHALAVGVEKALIIDLVTGDW
jgi:hypothetical protein